MAPLSVRRRSPWILLAGVIALLTVFLAPPAVAGLGTWTSARLYGGTVFAVAASPADPSLVLAGTGGAGVFRSTDGGAAWSRSSSGLPHGQHLGQRGGHRAVGLAGGVRGRADDVAQR
jgi:hypothetical protein